MFSNISDEEAWRRLPLTEAQRAEFDRLVREYEESKALPMAAAPGEVHSAETACQVATGRGQGCEEPRP